MLALNLKAAIPSLVCLFVLCFLPWAARQSLTFWRALQVYDGQISKSPPQKVKSSKLMRMVKAIPILLFLGLEIAFFTSSSKNSPIIKHIRNAVPDFILSIIVLVGSKLFIHYCTASVLMVSRNWNADKDILDFPVLKKEGQDDAKSSKTSRTHSAIVMITYIAFTAGTISFSKTLSSQAPLYLAAASGAIVIIATLPYQRIGGKRLTFRGLVMWPLKFFALLIAFFIVIFGLAFCIEMYRKHHKTSKDVKQTGQAESSWSLDGMDKDLDVAQVLSMIYAYIWAGMVGASTALVCFAYRYDASQAGHGTVDAKDADEIITNSTQPKDIVGRVPICLSAATLPRSTLSSKDLSTYKAGLRTFVAVQLAGILIDATTEWQKPVFFPTNVSQLPSEHFIAFSFWPLLAYPIICLAMIASVCFQSDRTFKSLWTYGEEWMVDCKPSLEQKVPEVEQLEKGEEEA